MKTGSRTHRKYTEEYNPVAIPIRNEEKQLVVYIEKVPQFCNNTTCSDIEDIKRIQKIERKTLRPSYEYRNYMDYLKKNMSMTRCSFLPNIVTGIGNLHVEMHHSPFTLFDLTLIVCNKHITLYGSADEFDVSDEIMRLHYLNQVGLIPVSPTVHELINSTGNDVHPGLVYGDWNTFIRDYLVYFPVSMRIKKDNILSYMKKPLNISQAFLKTHRTVLQYADAPIDHIMLENLLVT